MGDPYEDRQRDIEANNLQIQHDAADRRTQAQQDLLDTLKGPARPFQITGKLGKESVIVWLMWAAIVGGILTRSLIGTLVCAGLMYLGWLLFKKSFGGYFMGRTYEPSKLTASFVIGAIAGFIAAFVIRHVSVFLCTAIGAGLGMAFYQLVLVKRGAKPDKP